MKYPKVAIVLFIIALGAFVMAVFGEYLQSVYLAVGVLCLILAYVANQRLLKTLTVDPFTSQQIDTVVVVPDNDEN